MPSLLEDEIAARLADSPDHDLKAGGWFSPPRYIDPADLVAPVKDLIADGYDRDEAIDQAIYEAVLDVADRLDEEAEAEAAEAAEAAEEAEEAERRADPFKLNKAERKWLEALLSGELADDREDWPRRDRARADHRDDTVRAELAAGARVTFISKFSTVYIERPDGSTARVSDHLLPLTDEREHNRARGLTGKWDEDLTLGA